MYLLYEHHKDSAGALLATDMLMSSRFPGKPGINFKNPAEAAFFEFTKKTFKEVHASQRTYDPDTKIWSFFGGIGASIYKILKESPFASFAGGIAFERIEDLAEAVKRGYVAKPEKLAFDPSDFFYTSEAPVPSGPSRSEAEKQLALLVGLEHSELKGLDPTMLRKVYLRAALRLHPDRNNGDATGMTNLNFYWQALNGGK